jgi:hypothetical protein
LSTVDAGYPVQVQIDQPQRLSRLLIFVKGLLAIPHIIVLYVLGIISSFVLLLAWFAVLFTGRYPRSLFDFLVGFERWRLRVGAYLLLQTDVYPPFSFDDDPNYPARLEVYYPERIARWRPLLNWLLALPVFILLALYGVVAYIGVIIAWFAILFTGRYPEGLFNFVTGLERWSFKATIYYYFMSDVYPSNAN